VQERVKELAGNRGRDKDDIGIDTDGSRHEVDATQDAGQLEACGVEDFAGRSLAGSQRYEETGCIIDVYEVNEREPVARYEDGATLLEAGKEYRLAIDQGTARSNRVADANTGHRESCTSKSIGQEPLAEHFANSVST
jgi:hypothetical protein